MQAAVATYDRLRWHAIDPSLRADLDAIQTVGAGDVRVLSRTLDDSKWVVSTTVSDGPLKFWLYDRSKKKLEFLFTNVKALEDEKLAKMNPVIVKSRDGLDLVSYLTLPREADADGDGKPDAGKGRSRWCCSCTAGRGAATRTRSTRATSGSRHAATPC